MVFGRLLSKRSKDPSPGYTAPANNSFSQSSSYSVPVLPAYPVDGRLNKDHVAVDSKPYAMPDFPIMANNANANPKPAKGNVLARKAVGSQDNGFKQPNPQAYQVAIPRPPFSPNGDNVGGHNAGINSFYHHNDDPGQRPSAVPVPIHPMTIPIPSITATGGNNRARNRQSGGGGGRLFGFGGGGSSSNNDHTGSGSSSGGGGGNNARPNVDVPDSEVRRCTKLLRSMFELQLDMWSMRHAYAADMPLRAEKKRKADALLVEIQNMVGTWMATSGANWSREETAQVQYIGKYLDRLSQNKFW